MTKRGLRYWAGFLAGRERREARRREAELHRIRSHPRRTRLTTGLLGRPLLVADGLSFYHSYREIFERELYGFDARRESPFIIDGGASIGLAVIFFKRTYPKSRILAFEPDPDIFRVLETNVASFGCRGVTLANKALWTRDGTMAFAPDGADSGRLLRAAGPAAGERPVEVATEALRPHLQGEPVDFLKLDIEGAEVDVVLDAAGLLGNVGALFVEYHSFAGEAQRLDELLRALRAAGFRVQVHTQHASSRPLRSREVSMGMDLQLNIFGYRE